MHKEAIEEKLHEDITCTYLPDILETILGRVLSKTQMKKTGIDIKIIPMEANDSNGCSTIGIITTAADITHISSGITKNTLKSLFSSLCVNLIISRARNVRK